jgi:hypothetical protein
MVLMTHVRKLTISEGTTFPVKSLEDTIALCILLNQLRVELLGKTIHLGLARVVDPSSSEVDNAFPAV